MSLASRLQIRQSFSKASHSYERAAQHQLLIARHLVDIIKADEQAGMPQTLDQDACIMDIGSGTGFVSLAAKEQSLIHNNSIRLDISESMLKQDPDYATDTSAQFICADLQHLPFRNNSMHRLVSSYAFQWASDSKILFQELSRVLKPGACVYFSIPAPSTFEELKQAWQEIDDNIHVHSFLDQQTLIRLAEQNNLECLHFSQKMDVLSFAHQKQALAHIKDIGAHNLDSNRSKHLLGKSHYFQFSKAFKQQSKINNAYSLSYHSYFFGFKKQSTQENGVEK